MCLRSFPRSQVYGGLNKAVQVVSDATVSKIIGKSVMAGTEDVVTKLIRDPKRPEHLLALYADAADSHERLRQLGDEVVAAVAAAHDSGDGGKSGGAGGDDTKALKVLLKEKQVLKVLLPTPKGIERAMVKTKEKYGGCYNRLTDLARMTVTQVPS